MYLKVPFIRWQKLGKESEGIKDPVLCSSLTSSTQTLALCGVNISALPLHPPKVSNIIMPN